MYTSYCYLYHVHPANQLTIMGEAVCHKKVGDPCLTVTLLLEYYASQNETQHLKTVYHK